MKTSTELMPVTEETPRFRNIKISDIVVNGAEKAVFLQGLPEMNIENVELKDMILDANNGFTVIDANGVKIKNIELNTEKQTAIEIFNGKNIEIDNFKYDFDKPENLKVNGSVCENISIQSKSKKLEQFVTIGDEVKSGAVKF